MENEVPVYFGDRSVCINTGDWRYLINNGSPTAFNSVVVVLRKVIRSGGHFMLVNADGTIHWRIDRMTDANELVAEANQERISVGKEPLLEDNS